MSLAVVGMGLVTPFGNTPAQNVLFLRASVPGPPPRRFRRSRDGAPLYANYCRWIGPRATLGDRLQQMALRALGDARDASGGVYTKRDTQIVLCGPSPRVGVEASTLDGAARAIAEHGAVQRCTGDAAPFGALGACASVLKSGQARVAVFMAVDSFISVEQLDDLASHGESTWALDPPVPSEGAAALALMDPAEARRSGVPIVGTLVASATAKGEAHDDNDAPIDGAAMSAVLRALPLDAHVHASFGPSKVDWLRQTEWQFACARLRDRFAEGCAFTCLEGKVGRLGAASGLANAVYGLAALRLRADPRPAAWAAPFFAWAISPDGTRGAAVLRAGGG